MVTVLNPPEALKSWRKCSDSDFFDLDDAAVNCVPSNGNGSYPLVICYIAIEHCSNRKTKIPIANGDFLYLCKCLPKGIDCDWI